MKQKAKISDWNVIRHPLYGDYVLTGTVSGHPRQTEFKQHTQATSKLLSINFETNLAETSNTIYELVEKSV